MIPDLLRLFCEDTTLTKLDLDKIRIETPATWTAPDNGGSTITGYDLRFRVNDADWTEGVIFNAILSIYNASS